MRKYDLLLIAGLLLFCFVNTAGGATLSISPTNTHALVSGDTVSFDVWFNADEDGDTLVGATLNLGYDASELTFLGYATPLGWEEFFGSVQAVTMQDSTYLVNYNQNYAWDGSPIDVAGGGQVSLGTFSFQVTNGLLADGLSDLWLVDEVSADVNTTYQSVISYNDLPGEYASTLLIGQGADIAPIPVPAAVWLLGSGLLGVLGLRRRKT